MPGLFFAHDAQGRRELLLPWSAIMAEGKRTAKDAAAGLARQLSEVLLRERIVPRFVDSYVVENGRHALQVHAALYRDLLVRLQREALLACSVQALRIVCHELRPPGRLKRRPMAQREATLFRKEFLAALARQQNWTAGDALDFQRDLHMYEDLLAHPAAPRRIRKPFEVANHPFVDRCAFLLDSSFLEKARLAASRALTELEKLAMQACETGGSDRMSVPKN
jgi:hypothetical protein